MAEGDKRAHPRFRMERCKAQVLERRLFGLFRRPIGEEVPVINMGLGGMQLVCPEAVVAGQKIPLRMRLPGLGKALELLGKVVWWRQFRTSGHTYFRVGLEFAESGASSHRDLESVLAMESTRRRR